MLQKKEQSEWEKEFVLFLFVEVCKAGQTHFRRILWNLSRIVRRNGGKIVFLPKKMIIFNFSLLSSPLTMASDQIRMLSAKVEIAWKSRLSWPFTHATFTLGLISKALVTWSLGSEAIELCALLNKHMKERTNCIFENAVNLKVFLFEWKKNLVLFGSLNEFYTQNNCQIQNISSAMHQSKPKRI